MSDWPKRCGLEYDRSLHGRYIMEVEEGEYVKYEDFERLLTFTVNSLNPRYPFPWSLDKLKENILLQLKKEAEND